MAQRPDVSNTFYFYKDTVIKDLPQINALSTSMHISRDSYNLVRSLTLHSSAMVGALLM